MAETIIITSNVDPQEWYRGCDNKSRQAMFRRFDTVIYFDSEGDMIEQSVEIKPMKRIDPMSGADLK